MKKLFYFLPLLLITALSYGQVAINLLPPNSNPADSAIVPGYIGGTTKGILGRDLARGKVDSVKVINDSVFYYKWSGNRFFAGIAGGLVSFNGRTATAVVPTGSDYSAYYPLFTGSYDNPSWIIGLDWTKIENVPNYITTINSFTPTSLVGIVAGNTGGHTQVANLAPELNYNLSTNTLSALLVNASRNGILDFGSYNNFTTAFSWGNHAIQGYLKRDSLPDDSVYLFQPLFTVIGTGANMDSSGIYYASDTTDGVITILQKHQYDTAYQKFTKSGVFSSGTITFTRNDNTTWTVTGLGGGGGSGTVTSVALTVPSWLTVGGSPVTTAGTLAVTATSGQTANQFLATPNGSTGAVGLRAIVAADVPNLSAAKITSGSLITSVIATGTASANFIPVTDGSGNIAWAAQPTGTLPSQTGNSGKILTTDGVNPSWISNPAAALTNTYIGVGNGSNVLAGASTYTWNGQIMQMGTATASSTTNTVRINMGGTYSPGLGGNLKLVLFDDGSHQYGLGVSAGGFDHVIGDAVSDFNFLANGTNWFVISNAGQTRFFGGFVPHRRAVSDAATTIAATDYLIGYTLITAARAVTLPSASSVAGQFFTIQDETGTATSTNKITIVGSVNGVSNPDAITGAYGTYKIYSNGTSFIKIN